MFSVTWLKKAAPGTVLYINSYIIGKTQNNTWISIGYTGEGPIGYMSSYSMRGLSTMKQLSFTPLFGYDLEEYQLKIDWFNENYGFNIKPSKHVVKMVIV